MKKAALLPILVVAYVVALALALAPVAEAQQPKKVPRIGYLSNSDPVKPPVPRGFGWLCASAAT
jgi:hypothetical protein